MFCSVMYKVYASSSIWILLAQSRTWLLAEIDEHEGK